MLPENNKGTKSSSKYLLFYITCADDVGGPFWEYGQINGAILAEDFSLEKDLGSLFTSDRDDYWRSHHLLAGSLWSGEGNSVYFFYGGCPQPPNLLFESLGFSKGVIKNNWEFDWEPPQPLKFIDWGEHYDYCYHPEYPDQIHRQWRDPFIVFHQNKYWMFTSAAAKTTSKLYKGCVGLSVADNLEGPYTALPPALFPHFNTEEGEEGIVYECERSHVYYQDGMWHLFFCVWQRRTNPLWFEQIGEDVNAVADSSLYHYVSPEIQGPYTPVSKLPVVKGSSESNLYATSFILGLEEELVAYGLDIESLSLDVSGHWKVLWDKGYPEIKKVNSWNGKDLTNLYWRLKPEGHQVWDAMLLKLPA
ncbi:MAG: glycoside hydrolase family 68 protein [Symploca sp. SIO2E9]|nr:glycoside hydrolase family 68 protein [Symploca sp. SIO2E9]